MRVRSPTLGRSAATLLLATAFGLAARVARASDGYGALSENQDLAMARIAPASPRTFFLRNASEARGCPDALPACRAKAFLVPGDPVIIARTRGAFACVDYIGPQGADRAGWPPASALVREDEPTLEAADWTGTWTRDEASVTIKPAAAGALSIHGDATFGALDPERVKRGAVNVGEIAGTTSPSGRTLSFTVGDKATLSIDKGDPSGCKVWMRRLGSFLLVDDNTLCGGMNVSFRGAYSRAK